MCVFKTFITLVAVVILSLQAHGFHMHNLACPDGAIYSHNICQDPVHRDRTFSNTSRYIPRNLKPHLRAITRNKINDVQNEMNVFATEHIRCDFCIQQLEHANINDIINIEQDSRAHNSQNRITNTYTRMNLFIERFHRLSCKYNQLAVDKCCLQFSEIYAKIYNKVLSKWWILQDRLGDRISNDQCAVEVANIPNDNIICENIRNIIYILLRDAKRVLEDSLDVLNEM